MLYMFANELYVSEKDKQGPRIFWNKQHCMEFGR